MLEKTVIDGQTLALSMQISTQVGDRKNGEVMGIGFTCGFPLEWSAEAINEVLDKITKVIERQQLRADLVVLDRDIKGEYLKLDTVLTHQSRHVESCREHWTSRGKLGDFAMNDKQQVDYNNFEVSVKGLRKTIGDKEKLLEEMRERCR